MVEKPKTIKIEVTEELHRDFKMKCVELGENIKDRIPELLQADIDAWREGRRLGENDSTTD